MSYPNYPECGQLYTTTHKWTDSYACDPNVSKPKGRGVTTWELSSPFTIPAGIAIPITFTCTAPYCYAGKDVCNITFEAHANQDTSNPLNEDVHLDFALNSTPEVETNGGFWISGKTGYGGWQTIDISRGYHIYNDPYPYIDGNPLDPLDPNNVPGPNTLYIKNWGNVDVTINYFRILRVYVMGNLQATNCRPGGYSQKNGDFDNLRVDRPCSFEDCGGRSYSFVYDGTNANGILPPNGTMTWTFDFTNYGSTNYLHGDKCLFNFNQMYPSAKDPNNPYVQLDAYINEQYLTSYYLSNQGPSQGRNHSMFPSYDLMLNNTAYNDTGPNTVQLVNRGNVNVLTTPPEDGINIYRIFATQSLCCGSCETAQSCWPACIACMEECQIVCMSCVIGCQELCQAVCQSCYGCQSCQPCNTCQDCQTCVDCQMYEYCPEFYYTCQGCESCQPSYT